jgi:hypothetical protein
MAVAGERNASAQSDIYYESLAAAERSTSCLLKPPIADFLTAAPDGEVPGADIRTFGYVIRVDLLKQYRQPREQ